MSVTQQTTPYQLFNPLGDSDFAALKQSIKEHGVLVPVEVDERGAPLDGHHRIKAWEELRSEGVKVPDYPRLVRVGMSDAEKRVHVRSLNMLRRHLSKDELREHWASMRQDGATLQAIADASNVSKQTVMRATEGSTIPNGKVPGKDGKPRPQRYKPRVPKIPTTVMAKDGRETARAVAVVESGADLPGKMVDVKRAERIAREHIASQRTEAQDSTEFVQAGVKMLLGDFRDAGKGIADGSVDLLFTDPPYPREFLPLWSDLSEFAARVLKPGGMLIAYSGSEHLPEVLSRLAERLNYWWCGSLYMPREHVLVHSKHVFTRSKPLLFFVPEGFVADAWVEDTAMTGEPDKSLHDWQQDISPALYYIEKLTQPGALVVDPFSGSGTTGLAARQLGREFIGMEIDPVAFSTAEARLR